jgi:preprotein translocase subunit SecY
MMLSWERLSRFIPTVTKPVQKLTFRQKITWTFFIIVLFYVLGSITAYGIDQAAVSQFEFLEIVFGSSFGSLITLGIGPIVTASIILQLFVGSKIINWDTNTEEGKKKFHTAERLLMVAFCIIEAIAYVVANAVPPASPELAGIVIAQLTIGGIIIIFMDEVCSKWGLGSGVSLFIAAGVAKTIFVRIFNPLTQAGALPTASEPASGIIPLFITSIAQGMPSFISLLPLLATAIVFIITIYIQGVKIELPMSFSLPFGKFGSRRWRSSSSTRPTSRSY